MDLNPERLQRLVTVEIASASKRRNADPPTFPDAKAAYSLDLPFQETDVQRKQR